ncbi:MAG TPA: methyltransferase domain-containing protein [Thermoanaerobaculia bacterium]|nr:methyltransferase domain-containing protein [Thermoanaerobaculia bacterium]
MLLCTVRACHEPLRREERRFVCARGHAFDIARSGYVNLLQPTERRSRNPGDSAEAVAARRRVWSAAAMPPLPVKGHSVLDVGCGDGYWLASIDARERVGIDISVPAIKAAAKRYPDCFWIVANADRFIPYSDASFDLVISITARMNDAEFRRVLRADGRLLVAVPAPDDLIELRRNQRDRVARTVEFFSRFTLLEHRRVTTKGMVDIRDVLLSSYRGARSREIREVTFSLDLLLFAPGSRGTPEGSSP